VVGKQDEQFTLIGFSATSPGKAVLRPFLKLFVIPGHRRQGHGKLMRVRADGFQVVLIGQISVGSGPPKVLPSTSLMAFTTYSCQRKLWPAARFRNPLSRSPGVQRRRFHFFPRVLFLGARIENVQLEFAQALQVGACL